MTDPRFAPAWHAISGAPGALSRFVKDQASAPWTVCFALACILAVPAAADQDPNRPTDRIAADLDIEEAVFIECFRPVTPEPDKYPSGQRQRANKAILLPCLQKANPAISNERLDRVMDTYRPEGAFRK
ncbi:MAG: hypothetical protein AAFN16_07235 [Pseudomonadota bacterium]